MSNLVYLFVAVALSVLGLLVLWLRNRPPAASPRSSIEEFHDTLRALAPEDEPSPDAPRRRRGA